MAWDQSERRAAAVMLGVTIAEGYWCVINLFPDPRPFIRYVGFASGQSGTLPSWVLGLAIAAAYIVTGTRLPSVRAHVVRPSLLKFLALLMALAAAVLEEVFSKTLLMNFLSDRGLGATVQVLISALAFGLAHGIWGLLGRSLSAALGPAIYTAIMGAGLAIVYLMSGRSVAPCIVAHFFITFLLEPGLLLAAMRGEMSRLRRPRAA